MSIEQEQLLKAILVEQRETNELLRQQTKDLCRQLRDVSMILYEAHPGVDANAITRKLAAAGLQ